MRDRHLANVADVDYFVSKVGMTSRTHILEGVWLAAGHTHQKEPKNMAQALETTLCNVLLSVLRDHGGIPPEDDSEDR